MDPTAPKNSDPVDPNTQPTSPIQPGQFVVSSDENDIFKEPPAPLAQTPPVLTQAAPPPPAPEPQVQQSQPQPQKTPVEPLQPISQEGAPAQFANQPSPTPYVAPNASASPPPQSPSQIGKLRIVAIALGFLLIVGAIGAAIWFFVLNKPTKTAATTQSQEAPLEAPPSPKARTSGGFAELPQATEQAQESTASPQ